MTRVLIAASRDPVTQMSIADLLTYLPNDLLTKVDIATMAHGLEGRVPFLDVEFVAWAMEMFSNVVNGLEKEPNHTRFMD